MLATRNTTTAKYDPAPQLRPAGKTFTTGDGAASCFTTQEAPPTPDRLHKYRKSRLGQPGVRVQHWGTAQDHLDDGERRYGMETTKEPHNVLGAHAQSRVSEFLATRKEAIYESSKTEPLGRTHNKHSIPDGIRGQVFGKPTTSSESTKNLLIPKDTKYLSGELDLDPKVKKMYVKSHAMWAPGEQKDREYNWNGVNPHEHRFGAKDKEGYREGVKKALNPNGEFASGVAPTQFMPQKVEAFRRMHADELGRPRPSGAAPSDDLGEHHVFGMPSKPEEWGARECIQGSYPLDQQEPDPDLGRSILRGCAPKQLIQPTSNRIFGVPSVRDDIPAPARRSVADGQNYGNEPSAKELLYPAPYATRGVNEEDFLQALPRAELQDVLRASGVVTDEKQFERVWGAAVFEATGAKDDETMMMSLDMFRRKLMQMTLEGEL